MKCSLLIFTFVIGAISAAPRADKKPLAFPKKAFVFTYNAGKLEAVGDGLSATGDDVKNANITLSGDGSEEFKAADNPDENGKISLVPSGNSLSADTLKNDVVIFTITAKTDKESVSSDIFVLLPNSQPSISPLHFPQNVYFGDYKVENGRVTVTADINLDYGSGDVTLGLGGDYGNSFEASVDEDGKVTLGVKTNLADDVLSTNSEVIVTLTASSGGFSDGADVVLALPQLATIKFGDSLYFVDYSEDGGLTSDTKIVVTAADLTSVGLTVIPTDIFQVTWDDQSKGEVSLSLIRDTLPNIYTNDVKATITAELPNAKATTDVIVKLPNKQENTTPLHFTSHFYTGKYETRLTMDERITIIAEDLTKVDVFLDEESDKLFMVRLTVSTGVVVLTPKSSIKEPGNQVTVQITAKNSDETVTSEAVIKLPNTQKTDLLYFTRNVYSAEYRDGKVTMDEDQTITLESFTTEPKLETDDADNFQLTWGVAGYVTLSPAEKKLPPELLDGRKELLVTIKATEDGYSASTEIVIKLNDDNSGSSPFSKNAFVKTLNEGKIEFGDEIEIDQDVKVIVDADHEEYLQVSTDSGVVTLQLTEGKSIPDEILQQNEFIIQLTAKDDEDVDLGSTDVVVTLPHEPATVALHFSEDFYLGEYSSGTIDIQGIKLEGGAATLDFDEEGNKYFKTPELNEDGTVTVELKDDLSDDDLKGKYGIIAKITAKADSQEATADIVVKLPEEAVTTPLHFTNNVYVIEYADGKLGIPDDEITVESEDLASVKVTVDKDDLFEVSLGDVTGIVIFTLLEPVDGDTLKENNEIIAKVTASNGVDEDVTSDVIVKLTKLPSPHFTKNVYQAQYSENNNLVTEAIKIEADDLNSVEVSTDSDENFNAIVDKATGDVALQLVSEILPDSLIRNKKEIIVKVTATIGEESETSDVVVALEKEVQNIPFHFTGKVFVAEYEKNDKNEVTIQTDTDILIVGNDDMTEIEVENNIFNATVTDGKVTLTWADAKDALKDKKDYVQVKLTATDGDQKDEATLYLVLPKSGAFGHAGVATISLMMSVIVALFLA